MKFKLLLVFTLLFTIAISAQVKTQKYSQAKIFYTSDAELELLSNAGIAVDHGARKKNNFIESVFSEYEINKAKSLGFDVSITIDDMKKHIKTRNNSENKNNPEPCDVTSNNSYETPQNFNLGSMGGFLTLDEMLQELDDMQNLYPNLITVKSPISNFSTFEGTSFKSRKITYW
jgi:hypothetical protein